MYICIVENKKAILLILDGWGYGKHDKSDAVSAANTPFFDQLIKTYPNSKLEASGEAVGLPAGQMGNSEVGHMNLGAGRVIYQELGRINKAVRDNELVNHPVLKSAFDYAKNNNKNVHFIGLLSNGGVHSHIDHIKGLCDAAKANQVKNVFIHSFMDGRDTDPNSGLRFIMELEDHLQNSTGTIASVVGRYYAMDRDNRWERVKLAYDLLVHGTGKPSNDISESIQSSYDQGVSDEFILPIVKIDNDGLPIGKVEEGDVVICFNFRTDRGREITTVLTQQAFPEFEMKPLDLYYVTMTSYDDTFKNVRVIFTKDDLNDTLGAVLEKNNKKQIRIAETEKYPHVTFFFSGGREKEFANEKRILIPSPKVATYDLQPEMSARLIADAICTELENGWPDFVCLNFANPDMVGHTGVFSAVVKAVETVDQCLQKVVECGIKNGYSFIILADHGNADYMVNADGSPNTAHTTNLVPCILIDKDYKHIHDGKLGDVAPTILKLMNIESPEIMTGDILVS
ncbi:2,3-bisphosphoglycerate-independent phosphoglycerate mutase [Daejeonella rubra]|uniref:2,3-bisphosphoglycerate-independent phosphoglycerate mutase n=1 Tax=Daejeonella rubra TaxID=990371 RepID=A0A1G9P8W3_9SPHI|nr:2,3-bisphosphoglycerate-independent phosphoglycerate mutase [Daejeonella rubra]